MVAEHFCSVCGTPFLNAAPLDAEGRCGLCRRGLTGFDAAWSYGEYDGVLRKLVHLLKFNGVRPLAAPLGRMMARALPRSERFDAVVPMPLHWRRQWSRGFNQSELLARRVAAHAGIPVVKALKRTRATPPQAGLTSAQRRDNVAGTFRVTSVEKVRGRYLLLIDDVMTTGATLSACSAALKRAGAARVSVLTLARADRRKTSFAGFEAKTTALETGESRE